jgi:hypothetical protein
MEQKQRTGIFHRLCCPLNRQLDKLLAPHGDDVYCSFWLRKSTWRAALIVMAIEIPVFFLILLPFTHPK